MKINKLEPRLVVVTGAGSGIGRATAIRFAKRGAHVVVSDRDLEAAEATVAKIRAAGNSATAKRLDVTEPHEWELFALDVCADHGVPDVLVNNAGMALGGAFLNLTPGDWDTLLSVNLMGVIYGCREFGAQMAERGYGHIVNIASAAAFTPTPVMAPYSVSKAGVKMLTECLRLELGPKGVGVSAVCPGFINTNIGVNGVMVGFDQDMIDRGKDAMRRVQKYAEKIPFFMSPDLVACAVVRAVRFDLAVVPVRSEAWLGYFLGRLAPGLNRRSTQAFSVDRMQNMMVWAMGVADRLNLLPAQSDHVKTEESTAGTAR